MVFADHEAETPAGIPVIVPMPVAPVVVMVITGLMGTPVQRVGDEDGVPAEFPAITLMVPVAFTVPHPPVRGILYEYVPTADGVPVMVIVLAAQVAFTPAGQPEGVPIPVAPVVAMVIAGDIAVPAQTVGFEEGAAAEFKGATFTKMGSGFP